MLKIYNTLTRRTEKFISQEPKLVKIYACGITSYNDINYGHSRQAILFDIFRNYFEYLGYKVIYVRNFTDIDDRIIKRANDQNKDPLEISNLYVKRILRDLKRIKVREATYQPRVTQHIPQIVNFIEKLIDKGYAYVVNGEVLYSVDKFKQYGKLSRRKTKDVLSEDSSINKRKPYDFTLWKPKKSGEPYWGSPWGPGRPGWHIGCSTMAKLYLGNTVDIHGGGIALTFPHHENEIAQSVVVTEQPLASYWIHTAYVNVDGQGMSSSHSNVSTIKDLLENYTPDEIRMSVLAYKYTTPVNFSPELLTSVRKKLYNFYNILAKVKHHQSQTRIEDNNVSKTTDVKFKEILTLETDFKKAMDNNFDTPRVLEVLSIFFGKLDELIESTDAIYKDKMLSIFTKQFKKITNILRVLDEDPDEYINLVKNKILKKRNITLIEISSMLKMREKARLINDYQTSDKIRNILLQHKISIQDRKEGTSWDIDFD